MSDNTIQMKRTARTYRQTIEAPPETVFPLLCPIREAEWLDGWSSRMICSVSGFVEPGAVFSTSQAGEEDTIWIVTRHDPQARRVDFARFTPASRTCFLEIAVSPAGPARSHVDVTYTYTSIAPAGNTFLEGWTEESFLNAVTFWERSMNHFLKTGNRLQRNAA